MNKKVRCCDCIHHHCNNACISKQACNGFCEIMRNIKNKIEKRNCYWERHCEYFKLDTKLKDYVISTLNNL